MKRSVKMALMLAALVVLVGGYVVILNTEDAPTVSEEAGSFPLWDGDVTALRWTNDGEDFAFVKGQSVWMREDDDAFPVNQTAVGNLADKIVGLTADRQLTDVGDAADYGLDEPAFTVTATNADGEDITLAMGDATPFDDGYYMSTGGDAVYVVADSLATAFDRTLTQLAVMEDMPAVESVTRVTVGDALDIAYDAQAGTWSDAATGEVLDTDLAQDFADDAAGLTWSALIETSATDEELTGWALDDAQATAVVLYDGETAARTLLLGGEDEDGDRYARLPDSRMVYTIGASDADGVLGGSIDTLWDKMPVKLAAEEITGAGFTWSGGQKTLAPGDMESETAQAILTQLTGLKGTARAALDDPGEPVLIAVLDGVRGAQDETGEAEATGGETTAQSDAEASGEAVTQTIEIYPYNVDSYWIAIQGGTGMLVDAGDVDKLIRMLSQEG